jgi:hypothetical protein
LWNDEAAAEGGFLAARSAGDRVPEPPRRLPSAASSDTPVNPKPSRANYARCSTTTDPRTVGAKFGVSWKIGSLALSTALNIGLFWIAFRVLTAREVSWRQLRGGAVTAGILYELLQTLGGYYVGHTLKHASNVYGTFGLVIGLLSWIYLSAHITLLAAEANVVATRTLWPRASRS